MSGQVEVYHTKATSDVTPENRTKDTVDFSRLIIQVNAIMKRKTNLLVNESLFLLRISREHWQHSHICMLSMKLPLAVSQLRPCLDKSSPTKNENSFLCIF